MVVGWEATQRLPREEKARTPPAREGSLESAREMGCGMESGGRARQVNRVPGPAGLPRETALYQGLQKSPRAVKMAGGPSREEPKRLAGAPIKNENRPGGPGNPEEGVGLGRPLGAHAQARWVPRRSPTSAPSRPGHLHPAQGAHPCSPARSSRPLPTHREPRPWVPGARAQQAPGRRRQPRSQSPPSGAGPRGPHLPALSSGSAAALAPARSGSGLFIHPFTLPPQASL